MGLLFKSDQINQIILFWKERRENRPQVISSKVWSSDNMYILYRFSCNMVGNYFIGAEHWLMPVKPAAAVSWRTFVSSWHDCRTQFIIAVIIPVFPGRISSHCTKHPAQTEREDGRTSHSGCDWSRRACSAAVLPPFKHHWLACIRARRGFSVCARAGNPCRTTKAVIWKMRWYGKRKMERGSSILQPPLSKFDQVVIVRGEIINTVEARRSRCGTASSDRF